MPGHEDLQGWSGGHAGASALPADAEQRDRGPPQAAGPRTGVRAPSASPARHTEPSAPRVTPEPGAARFRSHHETVHQLRAIKDRAESTTFGQKNLLPCPPPEPAPGRGRMVCTHRDQAGRPAATATRPDSPHPPRPGRTARPPQPGRTVRPHRNPAGRPAPTATTWRPGRRSRTTQPGPARSALRAGPPGPARRAVRTGHVTGPGRAVGVRRIPGRSRGVCVSRVLRRDISRAGHRAPEVTLVPGERQDR